jgi:hypothetical protein
MKHILSEEQPLPATCDLRTEIEGQECGRIVDG